MNLHNVLSLACASLPNRARYARDVIYGDQRWSGSDLKGKARKFGAGYARQRTRARTALFNAGGMILAINRGRHVTAVPVGTDDYGNAVYATPNGVAVQVTANRALLVKNA
jgi:hypothetical protein